MAYKFVTNVTAKLPGSTPPPKKQPDVPPKPNCLRLPYPPTVNHYWQPLGYGRMRISAAGKAYRQEVAIACTTAPTFTGRLAVTIYAFPPDKRRRDLDNVLKALLDAMEHADVYEDDNQIDELHIYRREIDKPRGYVDVCIRTLTEQSE